MPSAEIITIGTEILLGEIVDTNTRYIARNLRNLGIDIYRTITIGDNVERIAVAIKASMGNADIVITTGGLGPTVDDPTREAVALAAGVKTEYREELWQQIIEVVGRYGRTPSENNKRQAYLPAEEFHENAYTCVIHGVGMTDLAKRATARAEELTPDEYRAGAARVERLVRQLRPGALCFVGLGGYRIAVDRKASAGVQPPFGSTPTYVMPNTSGVNARVMPGELAEHLRAAAALADAGPAPPAP